MVVGECTLQRLHQGVVIEAFDGADLDAVACDRVRDTASHWRSVDQHSASTTHAVFAAEVGAGQAERISDEISEMRARLYYRID